MNILVRLENECDYNEVEILTREAFWNVYEPGSNEHLLAHKLRKVKAFLPELDCVAELNNQIVGNIMYSKAKIIDEKGSEHDVVTFGPLSILPTHQKLGIGSLLINHTKRIAKELGYKAIVIFGNPGYYHRFGFENAENFNISTADGQNFEAFMVLELYDGALKGISGKFYQDSVFIIDNVELEAFEKNFPYKEKLITNTQLK